jgi:hypothetical protein
MVSITFFWSMNSTKKDVGLVGLLIQSNGVNKLASNDINAGTAGFCLQDQTHR